MLGQRRLAERHPFRGVRKTARLDQADERLHLLQGDVSETVLFHERVNTIIGADTQRGTATSADPAPERRARHGIMYYATGSLFPSVTPHFTPDSCCDMPRSTV
jgi:hypothetical protein